MSFEITEEFFKDYFCMNRIYDFRDLRDIKPGLYKKLLAFMKDIKPIFKVFVVLIPLDKYGRFWTDYAYTYLSSFKNLTKKSVFVKDDKGGLIAVQDKTGHIEIELNKEGKLLPGPYKLKFPDLTIAEKIRILNVLDKHFPKKYRWSGSNNLAISLFDIYFPVDRKSLRESDAYPRFGFVAEAKDKKTQDEVWELMEKMELMVKELSPNAAVSYDGGHFVSFEVLDLNCEVNLIAEPIKKMLDELPLENIEITYRTGPKSFIQF